jgi:hypothetical protein
MSLLILCPKYINIIHLTDISIFNFKNILTNIIIIYFELIGFNEDEDDE